MPAAKPKAAKRAAPKIRKRPAPQGKVAKPLKQAVAVAHKESQEEPG